MKKLITIITIFSCITSCSYFGNYLKKGYNLAEVDFETLKSIIKTKSDVMKNLGSPTFINAPINDTYYYIQTEGYQFLFIRYKITNYKILRIKFDENNNVIESVLLTK